MSSKNDQDHLAADLASDADEARHFTSILAAFDQYRRWALAANQRRQKDFYRLLKEHQTLLGTYKSKLDEVDDRIRRNADFVDRIVSESASTGFGFDESSLANVEVQPHNAEKVRSTLRQFVRDWSLDGAAERQACQAPILKAIDDYANDQGRLRVLVPGAGLGRLAWEIAHRGHTAIGVEFSYHVLLASNLILNCSAEVSEHKIYPFVHSFSHCPDDAALLREVSIPDVLPSSLPPDGELGMAAGDFTQIFSKPEEHESWDVVASCFFLDTARNIVEYLKAIWDVLKPGGLLLSVDATTWHYEDSGSDMSIELSVTEVKQLLRSIGFEIFFEDEVRTTYAGNDRSNLQTVYTATVVHARKPANVGSV